jgi:hypothetical protein
MPSVSAKGKVGLEPPQEKANGQLLARTAKGRFAVLAYLLNASV